MSGLCSNGSHRCEACECTLLSSGLGWSQMTDFYEYSKELSCLVQLGGFVTAWHIVQLHYIKTELRLFLSVGTLFRFLRYEMSLTGRHREGMSYLREVRIFQTEYYQIHFSRKQPWNYIFRSNVRSSWSTLENLAVSKRVFFIAFFFVLSPYLENIMKCQALEASEGRLGRLGTPHWKCSSDCKVLRR